VAILSPPPDHAEKKSAHASEQERADVVIERERWRDLMRHLDPRRLICVDESGAKTNMARRFGRAPPGELLAAIPHGHWKTTTFTAGLHRTDGLVAPMVLDGPKDGIAFEAYLPARSGHPARVGDDYWFACAGALRR